MATSFPGVPFAMRWKSGPLARSNDICKHNRLRPEPIRLARLDSGHAQSYGKSVNRTLPVLVLARDRDPRRWPKGSRPLGTRLGTWKLQKLSSRKSSSDSMILRAMKSHTEKPTVRGRPTLKVVKRFWNGSVCKAYERSLNERTFSTDYMYWTNKHLHKHFS